MDSIWAQAARACADGLIVSMAMTTPGPQAMLKEAGGFNHLVISSSQDTRCNAASQLAAREALLKVAADARNVKALWEVRSWGYLLFFSCSCLYLCLDPKGALGTQRSGTQ